MPLSDQHLRALGRMAVNFQALEVHLAILTSALISNDQNVGMIVTSQFSFARLCQVAHALLYHRVKDQATRELIDSLIRDITTIESERNTLTHSSWSVEEPPNSPTYRVKFKLKKQELKIDFIETPDSVINCLADKSKLAAENIKNLTLSLSNKGIIHIPRET